MNNSSSVPDKGKQRAAATLDVEDEEERHARMQELFKKLGTSGSPRQGLEGPPKFDFGDRTTFPAPPSELLERVQAFLPQLAASNAELSRRVQEDPESVDIENVEEDEQYIEMNLGLGVLESRKDGAASSSDSEDEDMSSATDSSSSSSSDSDSSSDLSESESESDLKEVPMDEDASSPARPVRPLPHRKTKPEIVVLREENALDSSGTTG
ncbi:hypothetical protein CERSUDRAFT_126841 [Gelatoporia subvermispora B]|uniref:Uncharacterized protein n=1 Tax=Ceriporiopsis subvermispora (strain B) TaxID=914234 RepID=M2R2K1_CERS8|nr:hypothetical protein CERSUDRAFT_126841 [Gelatoporia subvermispora B]